MSIRKTDSPSVRAAGGGVAALQVDLLEDGGRILDPEAGAAMLGRDQRGKPAIRRKRRDEGLGIGARAVKLAPVAARKARADLCDGGADLGPDRGAGRLWLL
jgi:hypothetical protein